MLDNEAVGYTACWRSDERGSHCRLPVGHDSPCAFSWDETRAAHAQRNIDSRTRRTLSRRAQLRRLQAVLQDARERATRSWLSMQTARKELKTWQDRAMNAETRASQWHAEALKLQVAATDPPGWWAPLALGIAIGIVICGAAFAIVGR